MTAYRMVADETDYCVVAKAPGIIVHGDETRNLIDELRQATGNRDMHPAHRLDRGTSGLLIVAKSGEVNQEFAALFAQRQIHKVYLALSDHKARKSQGAIVGDMAKTRDGSWKLLHSRINPARTQFRSASLRPGLRLYYLLPATGKTHQLRVALKSQGAPILGDDRYGGTPADRLYLHAYQLQFVWRGETRCYSCLPDQGREFVIPGLAAAIENLVSPGEGLRSCTD